MKDNLGRHRHDIKFGPDYATGLGVQWQDGKLVGVWPNGWKPAPGLDVTYKGMKPIKLPPWIIKAHKK